MRLRGYMKVYKGILGVWRYTMGGKYFRCAPRGSAPRTSAERLQTPLHLGAGRPLGGSGRPLVGARRSPGMTWV